MPATEQMTGMGFKILQVIAREHVIDAAIDLILGKLERLKAEGNVFLDHRIDDLIVRVLKHKPDMTTQLSAILCRIKIVN